MRFTTIILVALRALRRNTMRSILTALGIIIGVGAVITMVSIGNGAKAQVEAQVASLGQNIITVFPGSFSQGGMRSGFGFSLTLTPEDAEAIAAEVEDVDGVSPEVRDRNQVLANGLNWNTSVMGESPDYPYIRSWPIASGSMFGDQEVKSLAKVAVIGKTVADQLFPTRTRSARPCASATCLSASSACSAPRDLTSAGRIRTMSSLSPTRRICAAFRAAPISQPSSFRRVVPTSSTR